MADFLTLARPYAKAAFDHASGQQGQATLDAWSSTLNLAAQVVEDKAFTEYLTRPDLTQSHKSSALISAVGAVLKTDVPTDVANFFQLLGENNRLQLLPFISSEFELQKARGLNETDVVVETAFALTKDQEQMLTDKLSKRFNSSINLSSVVNPALIAGVIIRAGDQVIDDSALGKLDKMRTRLSV